MHFITDNRPLSAQCIIEFAVAQAHLTQLNVIIHLHYQSMAMLVLMKVDFQDIIASDMIQFVLSFRTYQLDLHINNSIVWIMRFGVQAFQLVTRGFFFFRIAISVAHLCPTSVFSPIYISLLQYIS